MGPIGIVCFFVMLPIVFVLWGWLLLGKPFTAPKRNKALVALSLVSLSLTLVGIVGFHRFFLDEPLCMAAQAGDAENVKSLLEQGANPNGSSKFGTPLALARSHGRTEVVQLLLKAGARE